MLDSPRENGKVEKTKKHMHFERVWNLGATHTVEGWLEFPASKDKK